MRFALLILLLSSAAAADPLRLRGEALAQVSSPVGLLVLSADGAMRPWLSAEAVVWVGTEGGDALVIAARARTSDGKLSGRLGRFVAAAGALRPVHLDGAQGLWRLPWRFDVELFGGVPVAPGLEGRSWGWLLGGRLARRLGDWGSVGVAYLQRRESGALFTSELGLDAGAGLGDRTDVAGKLAFDLAGRGVAEAQLTASYRVGVWRAELYGSTRAASHLLPASSLFSVIGDVPSQRIGALLSLRAAPRLELAADLGARRIDDDVTPELTFRARLKLDERGDGLAGLEVRRADEWTGARATGRLPLGAGFRLSSELELVVPDDANGRGEVWPWGLVALSWRHGLWEAALAAEASSSPEFRRRLDVLAQLSRRWEVP
jgi:hypothetical protein